MKILLISSSPHKEKGATFALANQVIKGFPKDVDVEAVHLSDYKIGFCKHCDECHNIIMNCRQKDGALTILKKMLGVDGIILASPNYINQVTASMKALFDRSSHFIHCKRLLGKYIIGVVSSGSGQCQDVLDYIKYYANTCGALYSGGVAGGRKPGKNTIKQAVSLGKELIADIQAKNVCPKQMETIEKGKQHFRQIIKARKNEWPEEYKYWKGKDWLW